MEQVCRRGSVQAHPSQRRLMPGSLGSGGPSSPRRGGYPSRRSRSRRSRHQRGDGAPQSRVTGPSTSTRTSGPGEESGQQGAGGQSEPVNPQGGAVHQLWKSESEASAPWWKSHRGDPWKLKAWKASRGALGPDGLSSGWEPESAGSAVWSGRPGRRPG